MRINDEANKTKINAENLLENDCFVARNKQTEEKLADKLAGRGHKEPQQQQQQQEQLPHRSQQHQTVQGEKEEEKGRKFEEKERGKKWKKEGRRERQDRKGSERGRVKEEKDEEVAKVVMDASRGSRAFQIFVKVDNLLALMMDVSSNDKISDVVRRRVGYGKQDVFATCEGRILRKDDELKSCGVRGGSTVQIVRRTRGGGRNKDKMPGGGKKKTPKKAKQSDQSTTEKSSPDVDVAFEMIGRCSRTGM